MTEKISKIISLSGLEEVKKDNFNKLKKWKRSSFRFYWISRIQSTKFNQKVNWTRLRELKEKRQKVNWKITKSSFD